MSNNIDSTDERARPAEPSVAIAHRELTSTPPSPSPEFQVTHLEVPEGYTQLGGGLIVTNGTIEWPSSNIDDNDEDEDEPAPLAWQDFPAHNFNNTPRRSQEEIDARRDAARQNFSKPTTRTQIKRVNLLPNDDGCIEWDRDWDFDDVRRHSLLALSTREFVELQAWPTISAIISGRTFEQDVGNRIAFLESMFRWLAEVHVATHGDAGQLLVVADYVAQWAEKLGLGDFWADHEQQGVRNEAGSEPAGEEVSSSAP